MKLQCNKMIILYDDTRMRRDSVSQKIVLLLREKEILDSFLNTIETVDGIDECDAEVLKLDTKKTKK